MPEIICPGCGLKSEFSTDELDKDFNASKACRNWVYELSYYTLALQDSEFIHQLVVDTYAAQHYGHKVKPITITFALVGLYLVNEKGYTGRQVQLAHIALAKKNKSWPSFDIPLQKTDLTVQSVLEVPDTQKKEMIYRWCYSVWQIWKKDESVITALLRQYLDIQ